MSIRFNLGIGGFAARGTSKLKHALTYQRNQLAEGALLPTLMPLALSSQLRTIAADNFYRLRKIFN